MRPATIFLTLLVALAPHPARADTPQQVRQQLQAITNRTAVAAMHKDLAGTMADIAPSFSGTDIMGRHFNYLQGQAMMATGYARTKTMGTITHSVGPVTLRGGMAQTTLILRDVMKYPRTAKRLPFTYTREYVELTTWVKGPKGWQETSSEMLRDTTTYSR